MLKDIPLYISKSQQTTLVNKTGSWRFVRPQYNEKTAPLINYYKAQNKFHAVNGIGTIAEVTERLSSVIDTL